MTGSFFYRPPKKTEEIKKKRWNILAIILKVIKRTCMALGAMMIISAIISAVMLGSLSKKASPPLPKEMTLVLKIDDGIAEIAKSPSFADPFPFSNLTIRQIVDTLDRASIDPRVKSFIFNYRGGSISVAHIQELRPAIKRFRESGKKAIIYSSSYASGTGTGLGIYYFASAFDEIWMQPVGMLSIAGINMEVPFGRDVLDKLGVKPEFFQREEYKTAMESFARKDISEQSRETLQAIVNDLSSQIFKEVSVDRKIAIDKFKNLVDIGLLADTEALDAKLIDYLDYSDVLISKTREEITGNKYDKNLKFISFAHYSDKTVTKPSKSAQKLKHKKDVALIYIAGTINDNPKSSKTSGNAAKISAAIKDAYEDDDIKTIVLRIDSPGGSPSASETIRRSIVKAKEEGKKVVVSMGSLAASGGYWIATEGDEIYALPSTLTGSIGVIMGKFVLNDLWNKIGVNWNGVSIGRNSNMLSPNSDFNDTQKIRMNKLIDSTYEAFIERVAKGRNMSTEQVRKIAKGRAWTGQKAVTIGLVDKIGGLDNVLNDVAKEYGLNDKNDLNVIVMPKPKTPFEQFAEMFANQVSVGRFLKQNTKLLEWFGSVSNDAEIMLEAPNYSVYDNNLEALR